MMLSILRTLGVVEFMYLALLACDLSSGEPVIYDLYASRLLYDSDHFDSESAINSAVVVDSADKRERAAEFNGGLKWLGPNDPFHSRHVTSQRVQKC